MYKSLIIITSSLLLSLSLTSCSNNTDGGATPAASAFGGGNVWLGIAGNTLVGGIAGNLVGKYMDSQDQANMVAALNNTPQSQPASWTNPQSDITYTIVPQETYRNNDGHYCRAYQATVMVAGKEQKSYGQACRQPDGQWKIVN